MTTGFGDLACYLRLVCAIDSPSVDARHRANNAEEA